MPSKIALTGSLLLVASSTCDDCLDDLTKTTTTTTSGTGSTTTTTTTPPPSNQAVLDPATGLCEFEWDRFALNPTGIVAVCFEGEYGPDMISDVSVSVPCDASDGSAAPNDYPGSETDQGNNDYLVEAADVPWLCDIGQGSGTWVASFPPGAASTCSDYTQDRIGYVIYDAYGLLTLESGWNTAACPYVNVYGGYFMTHHYDLVPTQHTSCSPGSATFRMAARGSNPGPNGESSLWLSPLATEAARFPDRAWLRRVEVLDWGTLDALEVAPLGRRLAFVDESVSNGKQIAKSSGNISTFAVGDAPMSTMFGAASVTVDDALVLPTVRLDWSCEVNPGNPHFGPIAATPYVTALPDATGVEHRMLIWVDWPGKVSWIAPEGRFGDAVLLPLRPLAEGGAEFGGTLPSYGLRFHGKLDRVQGALRLFDAHVEVGGTRTAVNDRILAPLK